MFKRAAGFIIVAVALAAVLFAGVAAYYPVKYMEEIQRYKDRFDPAFICAVIHTESKFRPEARSGKNAAGLMQLTEATASWMASDMGMEDFTGEKIYEPETNIAIGCHFLNWLMNRYEGDTRLALCAYNAGQGNVDRWLADARYSKDGETLDAVPFPETGAYLKRVEFSYKVYKFLLKVYELFTRG
ncbi:MAG: lytic transglycosylase domain-containing protein [Clostridiales bacterium]|jgi:soluble lytic murein transglycosylase|nr:lytic transglycosylase domain-containing protein [Clostridiales bacterium]